MFKISYLALVLPTISDKIPRYSKNQHRYNLKYKQDKLGEVQIIKQKLYHQKYSNLALK
jgi:hypothetical protein